MVEQVISLEETETRELRIGERRDRQQSVCVSMVPPLRNSRRLQPKGLQGQRRLDAPITDVTETPFFQTNSFVIPVKSGTLWC